MHVEVTLLLSCVGAAGHVTGEVATTIGILAMLAAVVPVEVALPGGYIRAAGDIARVVPTAVLGVLGSFVVLEVTLLCRYIDAAGDTAGEVATASL